MAAGARGRKNFFLVWRLPVLPVYTILSHVQRIRRVEATNRSQGFVRQATRLLCRQNSAESWDAGRRPALSRPRAKLLAPTAQRGFSRRGLHADGVHQPRFRSPSNLPDSLEERADLPASQQSVAWDERRLVGLEA